MHTDEVEQLLGRLGLALSGAEPAGGGDINQAFRLRCGSTTLFLKFHRRPPRDMFATEAAGLAELAEYGIRVPRPLAWDDHHLVMEYLPLFSRGGASDAQLGRQLAELHSAEQPHFGWGRDNYIGTTPQSNSPSDSWLEFLARERLEPQVRRLLASGGPAELDALYRRLEERLPGFFADYTPHPALLHGDLWSGNAAALRDGTPVIFDPACYYGDREADLAMTELFGGFRDSFFSAYDEVLPLDPGYPRRRPLYQLYHILNHANLFGGGYGRRAVQLLEDLVGHR